MSGLERLRELARGISPADDGLLGNARCEWGHTEFFGEEAIIAEFAARPFDTGGDLLTIETEQGAALVGDDRALVADIYDGRLGRLWRVGGLVSRPVEAAVDVAFDPDMRQERGDLLFRLEDHPDLTPEASDTLLQAARELTAQGRSNGKLRVRGFVVRAFGDSAQSVALLSLYSLSNEPTRSAAFSYAVVAEHGDSRCAVSDTPPSRPWTPRL
jgi:hypothetical protein